MSPLFRRYNMNIELNNDTVTEGYLQWIEDFEPARPKDYMNGAVILMMSRLRLYIK